MRNFSIFVIGFLTASVNAEETRFSLMTYNVWKGWSQVDDGFRKGIESIKASGADIVGLQEASPELAKRIATELGWFRSGKSEGSAQIVSRYPVIGSLDADRLAGARILVSPNPRREIFVFNCHLDHHFYGPYAAVKPGSTAESVLAEERRSERADQIQRMLDLMKEALEAADHVPVFLTGDFNCPSHLDWTNATRNLNGGVGAVPWPPSTKVTSSGMTDSYRMIHPDPVETPGFTWSSIHKGDEPQDRIDFIYHKGKGVKASASRVFTTSIESTTGPWKPATDLSPIRKNQWPSDHAAVVTNYIIE